MPLPNTWATGNSFAASDQNNVANAVNANTNAQPASGTFASLPAAGNAGKLYICTDVGLILRDNGTTWDRFQGGPLEWFTAPPASGLTTTTLGTATFTADKDARLLTLPSVAGENWRVEYKALSPTSGYTARAYLELAAVSGNFISTGIVLYDSVSGKLIHFGPGVNSGFVVSAQKYTNITTFSAAYTSVTPPATIQAIPNWYQIRDDGTNRFFEFSFNGIDWIALTSTLRTDFLTPNQIGWGGDNNGGNIAKLRLRSWNITTP